MRGLMMDFPLTLDTIVRRAEQFFPDVEIVGRRPDRSIHRSAYGAVARRARHLAAGLESLGLAQGDRVATLAWNNIQHCETYFGVPCGGYVCHTLNLRLHPDELAWIATNAGDRAIIVDDNLLPLLDKFRDRTPIEHVIVINHGGGALPAGAIDFEDVIARGAARDYEFPRLDENEKQGRVDFHIGRITRRGKPRAPTSMITSNASSIPSGGTRPSATRARSTSSGRQ